MVLANFRVTRYNNYRIRMVQVMIMNRIKRKITKRGIITTAVIFFVFVMSLGYAALSQHMDIDGIAQVDRSWIIKVTNVTSSVTNGGVDKSKTYIGTTVTMNASLPTSTSTVTYKITLQNQGNLSAKLSTIQKVEDDNTSITYAITGVVANETGSTLLEPGASTTATVTIKYQSGVTSVANTDKSLMLSFDFVESKTSSGGSWIEGPTSTNFPSYRKGDLVTLKDGSTWQVTKDSNGTENMVTLAATKVLNSSGGFATSTSTAYKKAFDTSGSNHYNTKSSTNIGYFIENTFLPKIKTSITGVGGSSTGTTARLITEDELSMRILTGCTSSKANLCNINADYAGTGYWTMSPSGSSNVVIHDVNRGPYTGTAAATATTYTILPVITTLKSNVRTVDLGNRIAYVDNNLLPETGIDFSKPNSYSDSYVSKTSSTTSSVSFSSSTTYYFGTTYKFDPTTGMYSLAGTTKSGLWSAMSTDYTTYPYTCRSTSETSTCSTIYKMTAYSSTTTGTAYTLSRSPMGFAYHKKVSTTTISSKVSGTTYWIGSGYTFDETTGLFTLTGTQQQMWGDYIGNKNYSGSPFVCDEPGTVCSMLYEITVSSSAAAPSPSSVKANVYTSESQRSSNNGEGLYYNADDVGRTEYFRGNVTNNYVKFANKFWRIIRVNGDGSVRLVYQGAAVNSSGTDATIGISQFNRVANAKAYIGYMYGSTSNEGTDAYLNTSSSVIKTTLDTWYTNNLTSYASSLSTSTTFCNDRSIVSEVRGYYGYYDRSSTPSFKCTQASDRLSTSISGFTKPIGTITADEAKFAGAGGDFKENYLYIGENIWTMTPYTASPSSYRSMIMSLTPTLTLRDTVADAGLYVRPVINLKAAVKTITGNGTSTNPYVIT